LHEISHQGNTVSTKIIQYLDVSKQRVCGLRCHAAVKTGCGGSCDALQLRCAHTSKWTTTPDLWLFIHSLHV